MNVSVEGLPRLFAQLEKDNFFGTLSFQFRAGQIVLIRREETLLPTSTPKTDRNGRTDDEHKRHC